MSNKVSIDLKMFKISKKKTYIGRKSLWSEDRLDSRSYNLLGYEWLLQNKFIDVQNVKKNRFYFKSIFILKIHTVKQ